MLIGCTEMRMDLFLMLPQSCRHIQAFLTVIGIRENRFDIRACVHVHVPPWLCHAKMPIFWLLHNRAFLWCCFSITWHQGKPERSLANSLKVTAQAARVRSHSQSATPAVEIATALQFMHRNYGLGCKQIQSCYVTISSSQKPLKQQGNLIYNTVVTDELVRQ